MHRFLSVVLSGCALMATPAVAQLGLVNADLNEAYPAWNHLDVRLIQRADGRRESDPIPSIGPDARLYVRDAGVQTIRGARDRVCLDATGGRRGNPVSMGLSPVGAAPDGRVEMRQVGSHCVLLPAADAYRVWTRRLREAPTPEDWPHWTPPDVIRAMEPMREQDDRDAIERNLRRIIAAVSPQGVCATITVHRVRFDATDGLMHQWYWGAPAFLHYTRQTAAFHAQSIDRRGLVGGREITNANGRPFVDRNDGFLNHGFLNYPGQRPDYQANIVNTVFGAAPRSEIERYWATYPLDDAALNTQVRVRECVGEPITAMAAGQQIQPHYILMDLQVTVPHWNQYDRAGQGVHDYWRVESGFYLAHELVHVHDYLEQAGEIAFQTAGRLNMGDYRRGLPDYASDFSGAARHYGLHRPAGFGPVHYDLRRTYLDSNPQGGGSPQMGAVIAHFHRAEDAPGVDTGIVRNPLRYYGDRDAVRASELRSQEEADRAVAAFRAQQSQDE